MYSLIGSLCKKKNKPTGSGVFRNIEAFKSLPLLPLKTKSFFSFVNWKFMNIHKTKEILLSLPMANKIMLDSSWISDNDRYISTIRQSCFLIDRRTGSC